MSKYIAYIIAALNHDRSLSALLSPREKILAKLAEYNQMQTQSGFRMA